MAISGITAIMRRAPALSFWIAGLFLIKLPFSSERTVATAECPSKRAETRIRKPTKPEVPVMSILVTIVMFTIETESKYETSISKYIQ
jgi:hypothetical protein